MSFTARVNLSLLLWIFVNCLSLTSGETEGGNSDGADCHFPFEYEGLTHTQCIGLNHERPWCATTQSYDQHQKWGNCINEDLASLPSFDDSTPTNVTIYQGDDARLLCSLNNLQGKKVTWHKRGDSQPLTVSTFSFFSNGKYEVDHESDGEWNLLIHDVVKTDSGIYQCRVSTRTMLLVREIQLTVQDRPPMSTPAVTLGQSETIYVEKGKELILQCNATAKNQDGLTYRTIPPEVEWFKDGNKINPNALNNMQIETQVLNKLRISTLTVQRTDMADAGIYVCRTTDKANAEVAVRILNVDKENVKRGTLGEPAPGALAGEGENNSESLTVNFLLLLSLTLLNIIT